MNTLAIGIAIVVSSFIIVFASEFIMDAWFNGYMRQFRKHEKAHRRHMAEMDIELIEMTIQSMEEQLKEQHKDAHNPSIISLSESLEMISQKDKDKYKKKRIKPAREDSFWPSWDDYRNLDK